MTTTSGCALEALAGRKATVTDMLALLSGLSDSEFANLANSEEGESFKAMLEGALSRSTDHLELLAQDEERKQKMAYDDGRPWKLYRYAAQVLRFAAERGA